MPRSILVDTSVLSHGEFATPISVPMPGFGNRLILMQAKAAQDEWLRSQIEALPTLALLARTATIELHSYFELDVEHWRGGSFPGNIAGSVFRGVNLKSVKSPIERSLFVQTEMEDFVSKKSQTEFCEWLMNFGPELLSKAKLLERLDESQIHALVNLKRYKDICRSLSPVQFIDAWQFGGSSSSGALHLVSSDNFGAPNLSRRKSAYLMVDASIAACAGSDMQVS
jgi:hypothetical protein